jgi:hypothetical protein
VDRQEKRVGSRARMVVGVRLSGMEMGDSGALVYTLDISASGARLGGLRTKVAAGDVLILHRQLRRAKCEVMWVREIAKNETQIGVKLIDSDINFWGIELSEDRAVGKNSAASGSGLANTRAAATGKSS